MNDKLQSVQQAFLSFAKRAEKVSTDILHETFVDTQPLTTVLSTANNQILYGRRGTGKTHALLYLSRRVAQDGQHSIYIDMRSVGSDGSIYNDPERSIAERSVRLALDVLNAIAIDLYSVAVEQIGRHANPGALTTRLDDLDAAINEVRVTGETTSASREAADVSNSSGAKGGLTAKATEPAAFLEVDARSERKDTIETSRSTTGRERVGLNFGRVQSALKGLLTVLGEPRVWLLIDEWSEVPMDLQPYLADLIRRTFLPIDNFVVKIAAIEHRSSFFIPGPAGSYVGLELGADISTDLNLDDFLVFDNDQARSVEFFKRLLFRHLKASDFGEGFTSPEELIQVAFTQHPAFDELVRAAEGVPRDALNLAAKVATKAFGRAVSIADVRSAARDWYQQDKAAPIQANPALSTVLERIINEVIGNRKARAFLFKANTRHEIIDRLFDARVIHLLKKNISSHDAPGERYDAFKIDYGCYVELINTAKAPSGSLPADHGTYIDVPTDDYRSIRRAILGPEFLT